MDNDKVDKIRKILIFDKGYYNNDHAVSSRVIRDILEANEKLDIAEVRDKKIDKILNK